MRSNAASIQRKEAKFSVIYRCLHILQYTVQYMQGEHKTARRTLTLTLLHCKILRTLTMERAIGSNRCE